MTIWRTLLLIFVTAFAFILVFVFIAIILQCYKLLFSFYDRVVYNDFCIINDCNLHYIYYFSYIRYTFFYFFLYKIMTYYISKQMFNQDGCSIKAIFQFKLRRLVQQDDYLIKVIIFQGKCSTTKVVPLKQSLHQVNSFSINWKYWFVN